MLDLQLVLHYIYSLSVFLVATEQALLCLELQM
jgi:hypothetical protein